MHFIYIFVAAVNVAAIVLLASTGVWQPMKAEVVQLSISARGLHECLAMCTYGCGLGQPVLD